MISIKELRTRNITYILYVQQPSLDGYYHKLISDVLNRLPDDVIESFSDGPPQFFIIETIAQTSCIVRFKLNSIDKDSKHFQEEERWIIIVTDKEIRMLSKSEQESVIAEELAHVYLRHKPFDDEDTLHTGDYRNDSKFEQEAAALLKKWGIPYLKFRTNSFKRK